MPSPEPSSATGRDGEIDIVCGRRHGHVPGTNAGWCWDELITGVRSALRFDVKPNPTVTFDDDVLYAMI